MHKNKKATSIIAIVLALIMVGGIVVSLLLQAASAASVSDMYSQKSQIESDLSGLKSEQSAIDAQRQELQSKVVTLETQSATYTQQKEALDQKVELTLREIANIEDQITTYGELLVEKEVELTAAEDEQAYQMDRYKSRLRAMEEEGSLSYFSILFSAKNFSDLLTKIYDMQEIMEYDKKVAEELEKATLAVQEAKTKLEDTKKELEGSKTELETTKVQLENDVAEAQAIITKLNADINTSEAEIATLQADRDRVDAEIDAATQDAAELDDSIKAAIAEQQRVAAEAAAAAAALQNTSSSSGSSSSSNSSSNNSSSSNSSSSNSSSGGSNTETSAMTGTGMFIWPSATRTITSQYGYRNNPVTGEYKLHAGTDVGASMGSSIFAAAAGQVVTATYSSSYGNYILINHGSGYYTLYAHCSSLRVSAGQTVIQGQTIGLVGSTGNSTGPHLHFEIRVNGSTVNPMSYF